MNGRGSNRYLTGQALTRFAPLPSSTPKTKSADDPLDDEYDLSKEILSNIGKGKNIVALAISSDKKRAAYASRNGDISSIFVVDLKFWSSDKITDIRIPLFILGWADADTLSIESGLDKENFLFSLSLDGELTQIKK